MLATLKQAALTTQISAFVTWVADPDWAVRWNAVKGLDKLGAVAALLADPDPHVHRNPGVHRKAIEKLTNIEQPQITAHVSAVIALLMDPDPVVRRTALDTLIDVQHAALASHASAAVRLLTDTESFVRKLAMSDLSRREQAAIASHTGAIVTCITDPNPEVREAALSALCKVDQATLNAHVDAAQVGNIVDLLAKRGYFVTRDALHVLRRVEQSKLTAHVGAIVRLLENLEPDVFHNALDALHMVEHAALASRAGAVMSIITIRSTFERAPTADAYVRHMATVALGRLDRASTQSHTGSIVAIMADSDNEAVRRAASAALGYMDKAALTLNASAIIGTLTVTDGYVRDAAVKALGNLEEGVLASHAGAIVGMFTDPRSYVRHAAASTLGWLSTAELKSHTGAFVELLTDPSYNVHSAAVDTLRNLEGAVLASHAGAIAHTILGMLTHTDWGPRYNALRMLQSDALRATRVLEPDVLELAITAVKKMLNDATDATWLCLQIPDTLRFLKWKRGNMHWATARVYRARRYARFWYEDAGKTLCAPGGKWEARDRAEFEADFN